MRLRLPRFGTNTPGIDRTALLIVVAAVTLYAARVALPRPPAPGPPFGKPLPATFVRGLDSLGLGRSLGDEQAPVKVVSVIDYQCAVSAAAHDSIWPLLEPHVAAGRVRYTTYPLPLPLKGGGIPAASVLECASAVGSSQVFWSVRGEFLSRRDEWTAHADAEPALLRIAGESGGSVPKITACLRTQGAALRRSLGHSWDLADAAGLGFSPLYAVDGQIVSWRDVSGRVEELLGSR